MPSSLPGHRHQIGITRRELLQVGYSGLLGVSLSALGNRVAHAAPKSAGAARKQAKSVLLVFLTGAPSHHDMFDLKPNAPAEVRGEFKPIATTVPGIQLSEHLPKLAARAEHWALVRSLAHNEANHLLATHKLLTGATIPGGKFDQIASRNDWPSYGSALDWARPRHDGIPSAVTLPTFLMEGPLVWPGQHAGFLGPKHDPWHIKQDPNRKDFSVDSLRLPKGFDLERLTERKSLLEEVNRQSRQLESLARSRQLGDQQEQAFSLLISGRVSQAFDLDREPTAVRDRYGRHLFGQSLLLSRRLIEAGVPIVQANMGHVQNWDSHGDIFNRLKNQLLPPLDQAVSALLDDLAARGLLEQTLVVLLGEFGRSPKLTNLANSGSNKVGRDHWPRVFSGMFAGGGVRGGQVIGRSDAIGAVPATTPYSPADVGATVYNALGLDLDTEVRDSLGRPIRLNQGSVIQALYNGDAG